MAVNPNDPLEDVEGYVNQSSGAGSPQFGQAANTSGELDTTIAVGHTGASTSPGQGSAETSLGGTTLNNPQDTTAYDAGYILGTQEIPPTALAPNTNPGAPYNPYTGTTNAGVAATSIVPGDTTGPAGGHSSETAAEKASRTDHGTGKIGPDISGVIVHQFGAAETTLGVASLGVEDTTLTGGYAGFVPTPNSFAITTGNYAAFYGQANNAPGDIDTTNTSNPTTVPFNGGTTPVLPASYTLAGTDTVYGYPGLLIGGSQTGVAAPVAVSATRTAADGGAFPANVAYYYVVTAVTAAGETTKSNQVSATVVAATDSVTVTWANVANATGYKVYRGTVSGTQNALIGSPLATASTFKDVGAAGTAATPPATNTTGTRVPGAPTAVAWTYKENSAIVTFTPPADLGGLTLRHYNVVGYRVRAVSNYPTTDVDANSRLEPSVTTLSRSHFGVGAPALTAVRVHNLEPGEHYYFRVFARNDLGDGPMSSVVGWTPPAASATPLYPLASPLDEVAYIAFQQAYDRI